MSSPTRNRVYGTRDMSLIELQTNYQKLKDSQPVLFKFEDTSLPQIDYVLLYDSATVANDSKMAEELGAFLKKIEEEDIKMEKFYHKKIEGKCFVALYVPFDRLCTEAEEINLEMPLKECKAYNDPITFIEKIENKIFVTDNEEDFVTAVFTKDKLDLYKGSEDKETFFRPAIRNYLTNHLLIHVDIRKNVNQDEDEQLAKKGLPHLLMHGVLEDAFVIHDISKEDPYFLHVKKKWCGMNELHTSCAKHKSEVSLTACAGLKVLLKAHQKHAMDDVNETDFNEKHEEKHQNMDSIFTFSVEPDTRRDMDQTWPKVWKYQPLWKIRNYFGEQIAFYFAWSGHLVTYLWFPLFFGLAVFFYGLYCSVNKVEETPVSNSTMSTTESSGVGKIADVVDNMLSVVKSSFDNNATPWFALSICIWSTILTETWKRYQYRLAYEWDVLNYNLVEPDRPEFHGTHPRPNPITLEKDWYYPFWKQFIKFSFSAMVLLVMILIVFVAVAAIIVYRLVITIRVCPNIGSTECIFANMVASSLLNAISIQILGRLYALMARKLTDWENHRTQSEYDDSLIIKLFAFQFVNAYSSLVYIAFFRGRDFVKSNGVFGLGPEFDDNCGTNNNCMAVLSFQVLILMIVQPIPKLLMDIIVPLIMKLFKNLFRKCRRGKVGDELRNATANPRSLQHYICHEYRKPDLGKFPMDEYMEKIIQYGYLVLFATSFPLAPLLAMILCLFDLRIDAKRMLWLYRRPVASIASNIGMWNGIVDFMNICSVVSNAFLIAYTSSWGAQYDNTTKLIIVLGVEHAVFALKLILDAVIPDIPQDVALNIRRERYQVSILMDSKNKLARTGKVIMTKSPTVPIPDIYPTTSNAVPEPRAYHPPPAARLEPNRSPQKFPPQFTREVPDFKAVSPPVNIVTSLDDVNQSADEELF